VAETGSAGPGATAQGSAVTWSLLLNVVCPVVAYQALTRLGATELTGLCVAAAFPAVGVLRTWRIGRRLDGLAVLSLLFTAASIVVGILTNNPALVLLQGPAGTGLIALAVLASILLPRPLLFYVTRQFAVTQPTEAAGFDALWSNARFRASQRVLTAVCGGALLADALVRAALAFALPVSSYLLLSPVVDFVVAFGIIRWGSGYARRAIHSATSS
jgi:hypothetical protein